MRHDMRKRPLRLLVVGLCFCLFLTGGTSPLIAVEVLDTYSQTFQTIGARYRVVPNLISPDCTYVVPIRYNFGQWNPDQSLRLSLFGPGRTSYWDVNIPATYWWGNEEVAVDVPDWVPTSEEASWDIEGHDYAHQIVATFEQVASGVTLVQPVPNFDLILPGMRFNEGWNGLYDGIGCTSDEVDDCYDAINNNPIVKFFSWLLGQSGTVWRQVTTLQVGGIGNQVQKKLTGQFRAYKLYRGLETGNAKMGHYHTAGVGAKERMVITGGSGLDLWDIMNGYTVNGKQKVSMHPPGWGTEQGRVVGLGNLELDPVMAQAGFQVVMVGGSRYGVVNPCGDWGMGYGAYSSSDGDTSDYADDDPTSQGANKRIDIDFSVTYNDNANTITVSYGVAGTASWPMFGACAVNVTGGSSGSATFNANGDAVEMEFALVEAGISFECGEHPCWHGEIECDMGIIMDITYPTPDSVLFVFTLEVCAGAHAELAYCPFGDTFETCPCYSHELGRWGYECSGDTELQDWIDDNAATFNFPGGTNTYSQKIAYICANY